MNQTLQKELQERCPVQFNKYALAKLENNAKIRHEREGKYLKVRYTLFKKVLVEVPKMLEQGYTVATDKCTNIDSDYYVYFEYPQAEANAKLEESLKQVRDTYNAELEAQQQDWIESQIQNLLDEEKAAKIAEIEQEEQDFKKRLLSLFKKD